MKPTQLPNKEWAIETDKGLFKDFLNETLSFPNKECCEQFIKHYRS